MSTSRPDRQRSALMQQSTSGCATAPSVEGGSLADSNPPRNSTLGASYLTPVDLAEHFGVPLATIRKWRLQGTGPVGRKFGRHVRYRRSDVDEWVNRQPAA